MTAPHAATPTLAERQVHIRDELIAALRSDLVGPMREDEALAAAPSRWYLTGFLVPSGAPEEQRTDALAGEALENGAGEDDDEVADDVRPAATFLPSSMGLSFQLPDDVTQLDVEVTWGDYEELDEATTRGLYEQERARWRGEAQPPEERRVGDEAGANLRFRYWRRRETVRTSVEVTLTESGGAVVPGSGGVLLRWVTRPVAGTASRAVSLFVVNARDALEKGASNADERSIFQAELVVRCARGFLPRQRTLATDHPDDERNDLQFRDHAEWAVGHGVATSAQLVDGRCVAVSTTWMPQASVHRTGPASVAGVLLSMDALAALDDDAALATGMSPLFTAYTAWISDREAQIPALSPRRQATAHRLLDEARLALARMREGLQLLASDPVAFDAFRRTNAAMAAVARKQRAEIERPAWHLFQLAFLLLNLAGSAQPLHADRERVELLFFPTGGGKTEAYLGVAAFVLLLRRLRGQGTPHEGAGVAVLLRYTLRLLTLDQLRRASQLICALELQRREAPAKLGSTRYSIGLWVGRSATANRFEDAKTSLKQLREQGRNWSGPGPVPLASCPWCDTPLRPENIDFAPDARHPVALTVGCANIACAFSCGADPSLPPHRDGLPLVVVDEQVYRELPSMVIGTVDKFASLPWRGAVGMLFGRVVARDDDGFIGPHETPAKEDTPLPDGLLPPELILQDELHLITGPLGTMVGLYETAIDAICRAKVGYGPKVLASTATAHRSAEQIRAIFARPQVHLFPPQGLDDGDTFFAKLDTRPDKTRIYVGVAAPGRSAKVLAARTYTALLGAAQKHWEDEGAPGAANAGDTYMTLAAYFNALKELGGAQRLVQEDIAQRTAELHRRRPIDEAASARFRKRRLDFDVLELTSRMSTDKIAKAIDRLSRPFQPKAGARTDVLLASSMISVGVDIGRLGLMVVNGQPRTTAEYIQASSRVGRQTPGLVVTSLNLYKPRDRSHYERFTAFHESFYRDVEAASITPFSARAVDRGLAGLIVGLVRHLGPSMAPAEAVTRIGRPELAPFEQEVAELLVARAKAHRDGVDPAVLDKLANQVHAIVKDWRLLVENTKKASGTLRYSPWEPPKNFTPLLSTAVDDVVGTEHELLARFHAPTSMRDVEPSVHVWVDVPKTEAKR